MSLQQFLNDGQASLATYTSRNWDSFLHDVDTVEEATERLTEACSALEHLTSVEASLNHLIQSGNEVQADFLAKVIMRGTLLKDINVSLEGMDVPQGGIIGSAVDRVIASIKQVIAAIAKAIKDLIDGYFDRYNKLLGKVTDFNKKVNSLTGTPASTMVAMPPAASMLFKGKVFNLDTVAKSSATEVSSILNMASLAAIIGAKDPESYVATAEVAIGTFVDINGVATTAPALKVTEIQLASGLLLADANELVKKKKEMQTYLQSLTDAVSSMEKQKPLDDATKQKWENLKTEANIISNVTKLVLPTMLSFYTARLAGLVEFAKNIK